MDVLGYQIYYSFVQGIGALLWLINKLILFMAVGMYAAQRRALIDVSSPDVENSGIVMQLLENLFHGPMGQTLQQLLLGVAVAATLIYGFTLILRPVGRLDLVDPKRVILWLAVAGVIFGFGSGLFFALEQSRAVLGEVGRSLVQESGLHPAGPTSVSIPTNQPNAMGGRWHHFSDIIPPAADPPSAGPNTLPPNNTLDLMLAYFFVYTDTEVTSFDGGDPLHLGLPVHFARQNDANCNNCQPAEGYGGYFYWDTGAPNNDLGSNAARERAVNRGWEGVFRVGLGTPGSLFTFLEASTALAFTVAASVMFFSVPVGLVFALFTPTEVILINLMQGYGRLMAKTFGVFTLINLFGLILTGVAAQGNALLFVVFSFIALFLGWKMGGVAWQTVEASFNVVADLHRISQTAPARSPVARTAQGWRLQGGTATAASVAGGTLGTVGRGVQLGARAMGVLTSGPVGLAVAAAGTAVVNAAAGAVPAEARARVAGPAREKRLLGLPGIDGYRQRHSGDGTLWQDPRRARVAQQAVQQAVATPDAEARAWVLGQVPLAPADQAAFTAAVDADPNTALGVMRGLQEVADGAETWDGFTADGQLDVASPGMQALRTHLVAGPMDAAQVTRLFATPAGQEQLRVLVGAGLGLEAKAGDATILTKLGAVVADKKGAARVSDVAAALGTGPDAFGGATGAVDHLVRDLGDLELDERVTGDVVRVARALHAALPSGDVSAEARKQFAHGRGPAVAATLGRLTAAVQRRALETGDADPRQVEQRIERILRDARRVPAHLMTPHIPALAGGAAPARPAEPAGGPSAVAQELATTPLPALAGSLPVPSPETAAPALYPGAPAGTAGLDSGYTQPQPGGLFVPAGYDGTPRRGVRPPASPEFPVLSAESSTARAAELPATEADTSTPEALSTQHSALRTEVPPGPARADAPERAQRDREATSTDPDAAHTAHRTRPTRDAVAQGGADSAPPVDRAAGADQRAATDDSPALPNAERGMRNAESMTPATAPASAEIAALPASAAPAPNPDPDSAFRIPHSAFEMPREDQATTPLGGQEETR